MNRRSSVTSFKLGEEAVLVCSEINTACVELIGCDVCTNGSAGFVGLMLDVSEKLPISKQLKILRCAAPSLNPTKSTSTESLELF